MERSRPLKFRAWDIEEKEMRYSDRFEEGGCDGGPIVWELGGKGVQFMEQGIISADEIRGYVAPKQEVMQFTGLKDGNGKEIYEGDILENMKAHRFVMEYGGLAFGWRGLTPYANGYVEFSYDTITNPNMTEILELEIIGNIYEHRHLLGKPDG